MTVPSLTISLRSSILLAVVPVVVLAAACATTHSGETPDARQAREGIDLANRFIQAGAYVDAERLLTDALKVDPRNPDLHYYLGVARFFLGQYPAAEQSLRESIKYKERNPDAHNALGLLYNQTGERERAIEEYKTALADPTMRGPEQVLLNLGLCQDAMGKTDEAILSMRHSVEANPKFYQAHYELAQLLDRQDQTREAIEEYEVAATGYSSDPTFHYRLGLAYFRDHKPAKAKEHLTKVVASLPGSEKSVKAKEILALIDAAPQSGPPRTR